MNIILDIAPSLEFWRRIYPADRKPKRMEVAIPQDYAFLEQDVIDHAPQWMTPEILERIGGRHRTIVFDTDKRRRSLKHSARIWQSAVPEGSFYRYDVVNGIAKDAVYIASPAFVFLVAALELSMVELVALGDELCGLFAFDSLVQRGFRQRSIPLLTVDQLGRFLATAKGCRGQRMALAALHYVVDRSASPMETFDEMALCLPYRYGGYGIPLPRMNMKVRLSSKASRIARRRSCYPDMCWPQANLDIEHHGRHDHADEASQASDRARVNALKEMGYEVIELTGDQVSDLFAFEYIALRIARILGKRVSKDKLGPTPERLRFRKDLISWNASGGQFPRCRDCRNMR